ncbi:cytosine deaminase [Pseudohoeflea suaedae]|uniref:Cytosine deaminase n=1 Tax=Pseudohoeflea suaedae TaxID=877384 RepID=A0A4R5PQ94_9HYPH|nr:cytosine deaminase [Pseudohoeflea suaedae]TDH39304.1 cytosine deaminase [Pseudohoeflea suaedae]
MHKPVTLPDTGHFILDNIRVHGSTTSVAGLSFDEDGLAQARLTVDDGRFTRIEPGGGPPVPDTINGNGGIVLPTFVDCHTHLDKGHIWPRKPNPDGTFAGALGSVGEDRIARWSAEDVARRMEFGIRCAYAHGTSSIRTHLDSIAPQESISWPVFSEMRARWKGKVNLQAASLVGIDAVRDADAFASLARTVASHGGVLGAVTYMVPDLDELLDRVFETAMKLNLELDFHADETDDVAAVSLERIARAALRHGFANRILVGHCCSLARQPDTEVLETLDLVARAGLSIVSLPMCNMYLQDRRTNQTTPRWRGVTLLHEMAARGINVAVASDNTRDPFFAYGDLDMLEVYREATRILHFDHPVGDWPATVGRNAARAMGLTERGLLKNRGSADFILFEGRRFTELLSRPETNRIVIRNGKPISAKPPHYSELDDLMEG